MSASFFDPRASRYSSFFLSGLSALARRTDRCSSSQLCDPVDISPDFPTTSCSSPLPKPLTWHKRATSLVANEPTQELVDSHSMKSSKRHSWTMTTPRQPYSTKDVLPSYHKTRAFQELTIPNASTENPGQILPTDDKFQLHGAETSMLSIIEPSVSVRGRSRARHWSPADLPPGLQLYPPIHRDRYFSILPIIASCASQIEVDGRQEMNLEKTAKGSSSVLRADEEYDSPIYDWWQFHVDWAREDVDDFD